MEFYSTISKAEFMKLAAGKYISLSDCETFWEITVIEDNIPVFYMLSYHLLEEECAFIHNEELLFGDPDAIHEHVDEQQN